jgi:hypothetical protein
MTDSSLLATIIKNIIISQVKLINNKYKVSTYVKHASISINIF